MEQAVRSPGLPFLLSRDPKAAHPQEISADHRVRPLGVSALTIGESRDELDRWLGVGAAEGAHPLPVTCRGSGRGILTFAISTDAAPIVLTHHEPTGTARS
jgi:hypothetical protein